MKYLLVFVVVVGIVGIFTYFKKSTEKEILIPMDTLTLTSPAFKNGESIPSTYTCDGTNANPPLLIAGVPEGTASLVFIVDDPDAPRGTWDHWIKFNVSPAITAVAENVEPEGISGVGSGGENTYQGPCPHSGEHRYFFKLYALDTTLTLLEGATKKEVEKAMQEHVLQEAQLMGKYIRK